MCQKHLCTGSTIFEQVQKKTQSYRNQREIADNRLWERTKEHHIKGKNGSGAETRTYLGLCILFQSSIKIFHVSGVVLGVVQLHYLSADDGLQSRILIGKRRKHCRLLFQCEKSPFCVQQKGNTADPVANEAAGTRNSTRQKEEDGPAATRRIGTLNMELTKRFVCRARYHNIQPPTPWFTLHALILALVVYVFILLIRFHSAFL